MSKNPIILTLMFLLELAGLAAMIYWGWTQHEGILRVILAVGLPVLAAAIWGIFRVPGEPGDAVVAVPGALRLLIEAVFFITAILLLASAGQPTLALIFATLVVIEYAASYDRIIRFVRGR